jgi:hypothetical protein
VKSASLTSLPRSGFHIVSTYCDTRIYYMNTTNTLRYTTLSYILGARSHSVLI